MKHCQKDEAPCSARTVFVRMVRSACRFESETVREDQKAVFAFRTRDPVSCASESPPKAEECGFAGLRACFKCTGKVRARLASCSGSSGFCSVNPRGDKAYGSAFSGVPVYFFSQPKIRNPPPAPHPDADPPPPSDQRSVERIPERRNLSENPRRGLAGNEVLCYSVSG